MAKCIVSLAEVSPSVNNLYAMVEGKTVLLFCANSSLECPLRLIYLRIFCHNITEYTDIPVSNFP